MLNREEVLDLRAQGHTVDDDNEPVEENTADPGPPPIGHWFTPTYCPRVQSGHQKKKGYWINHKWSDIAEMDELELFLMCFPVKYIKDVVIPESNKHLERDMTMSEFFTFIGCLLFMACHPGAGD